MNHVLILPRYIYSTYIVSINYNVTFVIYSIKKQLNKLQGHVAAVIALCLSDSVLSFQYGLKIYFSFRITEIVRVFVLTGQSTVYTYRVVVHRATSAYQY
jgi:hypothetical protein